MCRKSPVYNKPSSFYASYAFDHFQDRRRFVLIRRPVVTCAMHGARFDVTTGKKVAEPMAPDPSKFPEPIPEGLQKMFARSAEIMSKIKTYDQPIYETKIEGSTVKVRM